MACSIDVQPEFVPSVLCSDYNYCEQLADYLVNETALDELWRAEGEQTLRSNVLFADTKAIVALISVCLPACVRACVGCFCRKVVCFSYWRLLNLHKCRWRHFKASQALVVPAAPPELTATLSPFTTLWSSLTLG